MIILMKNECGCNDNDENLICFYMRADDNENIRSNDFARFIDKYDFCNHLSFSCVIEKQKIHDIILNCN